MRRTIEIKDDEEIVIGSRRRDVERKPPFLICGSGGANRNGESLNLIKLLSMLTPGSVKLFAAMVERRDVSTNVVVIVGDAIFSSKYLENHMPGLIKCGLVKRIKRSTFMINPDALMPPKYRVARIEWDKL